ncbi:hypothetical protein HFP51_12795 [Parasphingopyxis sp. CP4]|nr:hypothetical protein [Parasphingopyxis sp. CP4]QLC22985.1 hypothetical protein HFP51_12795 [Parasphingopyxis sp. CP4]
MLRAPDSDARIIAIIEPSHAEGPRPISIGPDTIEMCSATRLDRAI